MGFEPLALAVPVGAFGLLVGLRLHQLINPRTLARLGRFRILSLIVIFAVTTLEWGLISAYLEPYSLLWDVLMLVSVFLTAISYVVLVFRPPNGA